MTEAGMIAQIVEAFCDKLDEAREDTALVKAAMEAARSDAEKARRELREESALATDFSNKLTAIEKECAVLEAENKALKAKISGMEAGERAAAFIRGEGSVA